MLRGAWLLVAAIAASPAPSGAQLASACFDSALGPWTPIPGTHHLEGEPAPPPSATQDSIFYEFPPRILLTGTPVGRGDGGSYRIDVPKGALPSSKPFRSWRVVGDTLHMSLGDGFTIVQAALTRASDRWVGHVRMWSDNVGRQLYRRPISLLEMDCASEPPVPAAADPVAPRSIPSSNGPPLTLAETIPEGYVVQEVRSFQMIREFEPAGYWEGVDSVLVQVNRDGLVERIEMRYPRGFDTSTLEAGLRSDFGPGRSDAPWPTWGNRITRVYLQAGSFVRVLMIDPSMEYR